MTMIAFDIHGDVENFLPFYGEEHAAQDGKERKEDRMETTRRWQESKASGIRIRAIQISMPIRLSTTDSSSSAQFDGTQFG